MQDTCSEREQPPTDRPQTSWSWIVTDHLAVASPVSRKPRSICDFSLSPAWLQRHLALVPLLLRRRLGPNLRRGS